MKENLIRIGCVLLGVVLTLCTLEIGELIKQVPDTEAVTVTEVETEEIALAEINEEVTVAENVKLYSDYEAE